MKVLVINCSPVRNGATAEIVRLANSCASQCSDVRAVCIDDYDISFCKGCRKCHLTAECVQKDDTAKLMAQYEWADKIISVSPSYWADIPGQFKAFIDRCTPWCDTHEPHASIPYGKLGYVIALRTGQSVRECEKVVASIEHFYGHLGIKASGSLCLCAVERKEDVAGRSADIQSFLRDIVLI